MLKRFRDAEQCRPGGGSSRNGLGCQKQELSPCAAASRFCVVNERDEVPQVSVQQIVVIYQQIIIMPPLSACMERERSKYGSASLHP